jgi:hypothetical protein
MTSIRRDVVQLIAVATVITLVALHHEPAFLVAIGTVNAYKVLLPLAKERERTDSETHNGEYPILYRLTLTWTQIKFL